MFPEKGESGKSISSKSFSKSLSHEDTSPLPFLQKMSDINVAICMGLKAEQGWRQSGQWGLGMKDPVARSRVRSRTGLRQDVVILWANRLGGRWGRPGRHSGDGWACRQVDAKARCAVDSAPSAAVNQHWFHTVFQVFLGVQDGEAKNAGQKS